MTIKKIMERINNGYAVTEDQMYRLLKTKKFNERTHHVEWGKKHYNEDGSVDCREAGIIPDYSGWALPKIYVEEA